MVVGDRAGTVGIGYGKANEVPQAVEKGIKEAKKDLRKVPLLGRTLPHQVTGKFGCDAGNASAGQPGNGCYRRFECACGAGIRGSTGCAYKGLRQHLGQECC